jgi:hypothetical protein
MMGRIRAALSVAAASLPHDRRRGEQANGATGTPQAYSTAFVKLFIVVAWKAT